MIELPRFSPWGPVQHCSILCSGVFEVDTARHGGIMVLRSAVDDVLSKPAQDCGFWENGYLCFEEDADAQIVLRELLDQHWIEAPERFTPSEYDTLINQSIEHWHPDYWAYHKSKGMEDQVHDVDTHSAKNGEEINIMDMTIRDMTPQERMYTYAQSQQIRAQTGSIGHLRGYFDKSGKDFGHTWEPHSADLITDDFRTEFDQVVTALRSDERYGTLLKSPGSMTRYSFAHPGSVFDKRGNTFGVRADTQKYTYLLRLTPDRGEYNVYCYCYRADWLAQHMARAQRGIRFITPDYNEKFRIPDGDEIRVTAPDGESHDYECRYIDDYHFELDGACHNLYGISVGKEHGGQRHCRLAAAPVRDVAHRVNSLFGTARRNEHPTSVPREGRILLREGFACQRCRGGFRGCAPRRGGSRSRGGCEGEASPLNERNDVCRF